MKINFILFLFCIVLLLSCRKDASNPDNNDNPFHYKLKTIFYSKDTVGLLCDNCPPVITQQSEHFVYDNSDRLVSRILVNTDFTYSPPRKDTASMYSYFYSDNSSRIDSYTDWHPNGYPNGVVTYHLLSYDSQNRLIRDSVTNPEMSNNKLTRFTYLPGKIVEYEIQTFPVGTEIKNDTMLLDGKNIIHEKITGAWARDLTYTLTSYRNPLSYVNNFSLRASDYKNGSNSIIFTIYNPHNITYNLASQTIISGSNGYTAIFTTTLDSLGRVQTVLNSADGNRAKSFEYY